MATRGTTTGRRRKKTTSRPTKSQQQAQKQMWAVVLFALGLLLGALTFIEGGKLWYHLHCFLFGIFGWSVYFLSPLMIYIAVIAAKDRPLSSIKAKLWQLGILIIMISGAIQVFGDGLPEHDSLFANLAELYSSGVEGKSGGVAGAIFALPLNAMFEKTGASIIIVLAIFVFVMLITGSTLLSLYRYISKPVKELEEVYTSRVEDRMSAMAEEKKEKPARRKPRFNIDVAIDADAPPAAVTEPEVGDEPLPEELPQEEEEDQMPGHPVRAQKASPPAEPEPDARERLLRLAGVDRPVEYIPVEPAAPEILPDVEPEEEASPRSHPLEDEILDMGDEEGEGEISDIVDRFVSHTAGAPQPSEEEPQQPDLTMEEPEAAGEPETVPLFEEPEPPVTVQYRRPPLTLLKQSKNTDTGDISEELKANAQRLVDTLKSFGVQTRITDICRGPAVTRYELQPSAGVKISKITGLADDIALNLAAAGIRIEAPIPNKPAVGIEVPNKQVSMVSIREIIGSKDFKNAESNLAVALGKDIAGNVTIADIGKMPHMLIAGSTGSGKSVCINSIIISLIYRSSPDDVKLLMVDPKVVELGVYNAIPHLLVPVVTDPRKAAGALNWAVTEMLNRYKAFADHSVRDLAGYNRLANTSDELQPMPQIVIIIDELADLMMAAPNEVEDSICRLAQMARAAGMHLVIATQRPSVDVITGVIKANIPSRVAFAVSSQVDSRTILDMGGAEKLLGRGDMLFYPVGAAKPQRVQGCFVTDSEVEAVVSFVKEGAGEADYNQSIVEEIDRHAVSAAKGGKGGGSGDAGGDDEDELLPQAIECVVEMGQASTSALQRRLKLGYARAARIIDQMEQKGIVGPFEGSKPRQVLISKERWMEMKLSGAEDMQLSFSGGETADTQAPF